jgi:uncharacterized membrane protein
MHIGTKLLIIGVAGLVASFFESHPAPFVISCVLIYLGITMLVRKALSGRSVPSSEYED